VSTLADVTPAVELEIRNISATAANYPLEGTVIADMKQASIVVTITFIPVTGVSTLPTAAKTALVNAIENADPEAAPLLVQSITVYTNNGTATVIPIAHGPNLAQFWWAFLIGGVVLALIIVIGAVVGMKKRKRAMNVGPTRQPNYVLETEQPAEHHDREHQL